MSYEDKKIVFITGGSSGLGWQVVKALMQSQQLYHIYVGCLVLNEGMEAVDNLKADVPSSLTILEAIQIDIRSDDSIIRSFEKVKAGPGHLDALINNAGVTIRSSDVGMREAWNTCYDVNVTGSQIMTHIFAPLLIGSANARLIFIASGLSNMAIMRNLYTPTKQTVPSGWPKLEPHPYFPYRSSKTALNMVMLEWFWRLREDGVKTFCVSPGFLDTNLNHDFAHTPEAPPVLHPSVGGILVASVVEGHRDQDVGQIVTKDGIQPF